jgi:transposase-like protein
MPRSGPRTVHRYTDEFKLTAVRLSQQPGIQVQSVAAALEIHPFMLSKCRKDVRDGLLRGRVRSELRGSVHRWRNIASCSSRRHRHYSAAHTARLR